MFGGNHLTGVHNLVHLLPLHRVGTGVSPR